MLPSDYYRLTQLWARVWFRDAVPPGVIYHRCQIMLRSTRG